MRINLSDIFNIPTAVIYEPDKFRSATGVTIDSRQKVKNKIFVAIKGKNFDGHDFVKHAVEKGAAAVIIDSKKLPLFDDVNATIVTVKNTLNAFAYLAGIWRAKSKAKVISLTGSNGKTTTKEILAELLSAKYNTVKTEKNNNNQIGVPLSIFEANEKTEILILEHGTNHFGEIEYTANIAKPDFALITNVGASHLQYFGDVEGVLREKFSLFKATLQKGGTLFVNNDDALIRKAAAKFKNKITYGFKGKPDFKARILSYDDFARPEIEIVYGNKVLKIKLSLLGIANAQNFLAAATVALTLGVSKKDLIAKAKLLKSPKGRLDLTVFEDSVLIDDSYNSNPLSVKIAVDTLKRIKNYPEKILVLGDMFELGKESENFHADLAKEISKLRKFKVLTIGKNMKHLSDALGEKGIHFKRRDSLKKYLNEISPKEKVFLVKGSRGMKMEEFTEEIKKRFAG